MARKKKKPKHRPQAVTSVLHKLSLSDAFHGLSLSGVWIPNEILAMIFDQLPSEDFGSAMLAARNFFPFAAPRKYRTFRYKVSTLNDDDASRKSKKQAKIFRSKAEKSKKQAKIFESKAEYIQELYICSPDQIVNKRITPSCVDRQSLQQLSGLMDRAINLQRLYIQSFQESVPSMTRHESQHAGSMVDALVQLGMTLHGLTRLEFLQCPGRMIGVLPQLGIRTLVIRRDAKRREDYGTVQNLPELRSLEILFLCDNSYKNGGLPIADLTTLPKIKRVKLTGEGSINPYFVGTSDAEFLRIEMHPVDAAFIKGDPFKRGLESAFKPFQTLRCLILSGVKGVRSMKNLKLHSLDTLEIHWCEKGLFNNMNLPSLKYFSLSLALDEAPYDPSEEIKHYLELVEASVFRLENDIFKYIKKPPLKIDQIYSMLRNANQKKYLKVCLIEGTVSKPPQDMESWVEFMGSLDLWTDRKARDRLISDRAKERQEVLKKLGLGGIFEDWPTQEYDPQEDSFDRNP